MLFMSHPAENADRVPNLNKGDAGRWWGGNVPERVVIATSSLRKAAMIYWWLAGLENEDVRKPENNPDFLHDVDYSTNEPIKLQQIIEEHIRNGDGHLDRPLFLGHIRGVPVFVYPQNGESPGNDPTQESQNKIKFLKDSQEFKDKDVVFIASDTIGAVGEKDIVFGKPRNMDGFPKDGSEEEHEAFKNKELRWGLFWNEDGGPVPVFHINALVVERPKKNQLVNLSTELESKIPHDKVFVEALTIFSESGLGGVNQVLIDWIAEGDEFANQFSDKDFKEFLASLEHMNMPELQKLYAIFHYMGVPAWQFIQALDKLNQSSSTIESNI